MAKSQVASLKPSDHIMGGLIDDQDVTFTGLSFTIWDYEGKSNMRVPALKLEMEDGDGNPHVQYYSAGDLKNWEPDEDGLSLKKVGSQSAISQSSNTGQFLASLVNSGFPEDKLEGDVSVAVGVKAHVLRAAQLERPGIDTAKSDRKLTILLVSKVISTPFDEKKGKGKTKTKGTAAAASVSGSDEIKTKATDVVLQILTEVGGTIQKSKLSQAVFKKLVGDDDRNDVVKMAFNESFLGGDDTPWNYNGVEISLGE